MSAGAQVIKYERTTDVRKMLTSGQIAQAIINEVKRQFARQEPETNIFGMFPVRAATYMNYGKGARTAIIWDNGGNEERIDLPLEEGWRRSDGNPFGVPNGAPSSEADPEAFYLYRYRDRKCNGPVGFGTCDGRRAFLAYDDWRTHPGAELVSRGATASGKHADPLELNRVRESGKLIVGGTPEQLEAVVRLLEQFNKQ